MIQYYTMIWKGGISGRGEYFNSLWIRVIRGDTMTYGLFRKPQPENTLALSWKVIHPGAFPVPKILQEWPKIWTKCASSMRPGVRWAEDSHGMAWLSDQIFWRFCHEHFLWDCWWCPAIILKKNMLRDFMIVMENRIPKPSQAIPSRQGQGLRKGGDWSLAGRAGGRVAAPICST